MTHLAKALHRLAADIRPLSGLALFSDPDTWRTLAIYDPKLGGLLDGNHDYLDMHPFFKGIVDLRYNETYSSWEVDRIYAQKGYGPLLYLLAMQEFGNEGLMPSRVRSQVSPAAKKVWKEFYSGQGRNHVTFEDTESSSHDEDYLNKKYFIRKKIPTGRAKSLHDKVIGRDQYGERLNLLIEGADHAIKGEMDRIYRKNV
jgi:hypothetical protein